MYSNPAPELLEKYVRATNYLSAIQIYLQDNYLLERELTLADIKPRLLGHWGTCPGINFVYAQLNWLIKKHSLSMMFVLGPGHGFPALQSNLFVEGSLCKFYPEMSHNESSIAHLSRMFSWPYGFPSHSNPEAPGVILEGGELGYSLSTSYGAILDNPDLIVSVLVGDGEAETGPTAGAWHINKLINPKTNGAVLPILHVNGYKISGPTIFGRMSNAELRQLFYGYGYEAYIVEGENIYEKMEATLELAYQSIRTLQTAARGGKIFRHPRFPMIVLKTPKGWTGIKELNGVKIEGNFASHQVPAINANTNTQELAALSDWLHSYRFNELFDKEKNCFAQDIYDMVPEDELRMGANKHAHGGESVFSPLVLPDPVEFEEDASKPGTKGSLSMKRAGQYLGKVFDLNKDSKNFRLMSPDETYSNKLDPVFEYTQRAFVWPREEWDQDMDPDGRVMEMLSEHNLQGLAQGYTLTGRHAVFASYEAFLMVVASMADQYSKFLHIARETPWRGDVPSLNYILTSSGWEQEHNGFSHQNPGFIDSMLQRQGNFVNVYFPPDANSILAVTHKALSSKNEINVIAASKKIDVNWLTVGQAQKALETGMSIWEFASEDHPDIIFCAAGDYITKESLAAIDLLKQELPEIRVRFVNIMALSPLGIGSSDCHLTYSDFDDYFTEDKPVIFNFHGYPQTLKQILFDYGKDIGRFSVHGYRETGSTTTPFDMQVRNHTSRYHLVIEAVNTLTARGKVSVDKSKEIIDKFETKLTEHRAFIKANGKDTEEIEKWQWKR